MIKRIDFSDIKNAPIGYLEDIDFFNKNKSVTFKSGINVIVGLNGCGKTTLLNLIRRYTLCLTNMTSICPSGNMEFTELLSKPSNDNKICDGIKVVSDYQGVIFNMLDYKVLEGESNCLQNSTKFQAYLNVINCSTGEGISSGLDTLFNVMFDPKTSLEFPIKNLKEIAINKHSPAQSKAEQLLQYYKENSFQYNNPKDFEFTVLMDEPDRNLDINKIKEVYNILSQKKENTQIIAVVHNPILIYRLSKSKHVNIIEMTKGYVKDVIKFVESAK